jgi:hypothetical protein
MLRINWCVLAACLVGWAIVAGCTGLRAPPRAVIEPYPGVVNAAVQTKLLHMLAAPTWLHYQCMHCLVRACAILLSIMCVTLGGGAATVRLQ